MTDECSTAACVERIKGTAFSHTHIVPASCDDRFGGGGGRVGKEGGRE